MADPSALFLHCSKTNNSQGESNNSGCDQISRFTQTNLVDISLEFTKKLFQIIEVFLQAHYINVNN